MCEDKDCVMIQDEIQNNKLQILGKLSASLAHEIRNPLSALKLSLEYIKMSDHNPDLLESINSCLDATNRIQALIETTLDFSRTTLNDCSKISLNEIVDLAIEIMHSRAKILNIKILKQLNEDVGLVYFNKNKMLQVILNLITNAMEACTSSGVVTIRTYSEYIDKIKYNTIEIEDNGVGITEEDKEKIFHDFYTKKPTGTGLGLSVCKMILEEFEAKIDFRSQFGKGTNFFVRFKEK